jgi:hypothetical protein
VSTPQRVQRTRTKGGGMPAGALYVGRPTRWGNPFSVVSLGKHGPFDILDGIRFLGQHTDKRSAVARVVELYALHTGPMGNYEIEEADLEQLRGRDLACWCPLTYPDGTKHPCHADVLLALANTPKEIP